MKESEESRNSDEEKDSDTKKKSQHDGRKGGSDKEMSCVYACWLTGSRTVSELLLTRMILAHAPAFASN